MKNENVFKSPAGGNFVYVRAMFRLVQGNYSMTDTIALTVRRDLSDLEDEINREKAFLLERYDEVNFAGLL